MKRFLLDTSALLTLRDDEAGAGRVAEVLGLASSGKAKCFGCFITLMEIHYRVCGTKTRLPERPPAKLR